MLPIISFDQESKGKLDGNIRYIGATISEVNEGGVATIVFDQLMQHVVKNELALTNMTHAQLAEVMEIKILPGKGQDPQLVGLNSYTALELKDKTLTVKLEFENPIFISSAEEQDILSIKFLTSDYFKSAEKFGDIVMTDYLTTYRLLQNQMPTDSSVENFKALGEKTQQAVFGVVIANLAMNFVLSSSMGPLYNLINTLQIVLHY